MIQDFWETESTRVYLFWVNTLGTTLAPKKKYLSSEIECRSPSGLPQWGASYFLSSIPGPWVAPAWKGSSVCSYEENRRAGFSVEWYWTGSFSHEERLAGGKCSLRRAPAGSSNLSLASHEISDSSPPLQVAGDWVRTAPGTSVLLLDIMLSLLHFARSSVLWKAVFRTNIFGEYKNT